MNCCPYDLRDYWFQELDAGARREVEAHLHECAGCREELERLRLTQQSLLRLKDEEIPRRIAFVSDKVFEPSRAARWWSAVTGGVPRFAMAASLLLAVFFGGARISRPSLTVDSGRWQIAFGAADSGRLEALEARAVRHASDMQNIEQAYELLIKQMNMLYRQAGEMRPAEFRQ